MNDHNYVPKPGDRIPRPDTVPESSEKQSETTAESTANIWRSVAAAPPAPPDQGDLAAGQHAPGSWSAGLPSPRDGIRQRQRNLLYLQRTVGNYAVRRLVGDVVQRQHHPRLAEWPEATEEELAESARRRAQHRQEILELLDAQGVMALRQHLISLGEVERINLRTDSELLDALEDRLIPHLAYTMRAILCFGPNYVDTVPISQVIRAAQDRNYAGLSQIIAENDNLRHRDLRTRTYLMRAIGTNEAHVDLIMRGRAPQEAPATPEAIVQHQVDLEVALDARDPIQFLQRLRSLPGGVREALNNDLEFLLRIDTTFRRETLFMIRALLEFGTDQPDYVRFFQLALAGPDYNRLTELLRAYPELTEQLPYAIRALEWSLPQTPEARAVLAVAHQVRGQREEGEASSVGAHYDTEDLQDPSSPVSLRVFGGTRHFTVERTNAEIRVTVRIAIEREEGVPMPDNARSDPIPRWRQGIERYWNNQFIAINRTTALPVVFLPIFNVTDDIHYTVHLHNTPNYRPNMRNWPVNMDEETAAHEFGHMVGNPDEYNLPGSMAEIPDEMGLTPEQEARSSIEGLTGQAEGSGADRQRDMPGLMGSGGNVELRHGWSVLEYYNANMLPPGETPFKLFLVRDLPH